MGRRGTAPFFTSALGGNRWLTSRPGRFNPGVHCITGLVGYRAGPDGLKKRQFLAPGGIPGRMDCSGTVELNWEYVQLNWEYVGT
jgi:hypothetical protein